MPQLKVLGRSLQSAICHFKMNKCVAVNNEFDRNLKLGIDKFRKPATLCKRKHVESHNTFR